ncbi:MAG: hypothetical protein IPO67_17330 [Deltaproteobacteria bacterium]|nr:hypothetical protein [Deltaproteobacteria bacterium]
MASEGIELLHVADGKIREIWNYADIMGLAAQLGAEAPLTVEIGVPRRRLSCARA